MCKRVKERERGVQTLAPLSPHGQLTNHSMKWMSGCRFRKVAEMVGHSPLNSNVGKVWRKGGHTKLFDHPTSISDGAYWGVEVKVVDGRVACLSFMSQTWFLRVLNHNNNLSPTLAKP